MGAPRCRWCLRRSVKRTCVPWSEMCLGFQDAVRHLCLEDFLRRYCFEPTWTCPSPSCSASQLEHSWYEFARGSHALCPFPLACVPLTVSGPDYLPSLRRSGFAACTLCTKTGLSCRCFLHESGKVRVRVSRSGGALPPPCVGCLDRSVPLRDRYVIPPA